MGGEPLKSPRTRFRLSSTPLACAAVAVAALVGCANAPQSRYAWGSYEDQIYVAYSKPGALSPQAQADQMQKDRDAARAANQKLPPGWHAQLARVYFDMGRADLAREELEAEKTAFPEATVFVDRLIANMSGPRPDAAPLPGATK